MMTIRSIHRRTYSSSIIDFTATLLQLPTRRLPLLLAVALTFAVVNAQTMDSACTVCADGSDPLTVGPPCDSLDASVAGMSSGDTSCKNQQLLHFQTGCCRDPPYEYCPICPDGSAPPGITNKVPIGDFADPPTCQEVQYRRETLIGVFEDGDCTDTFLQRGSFYCGCPGVQQECWLCPDKKEPGNPDRGDAWATQSNCRGLQYLFSVFSAQECQDLPATFGVDLAAFCLCGTVDASNETTGDANDGTEVGVETDEEEYKCTLCDNGGSVKNPDFIYTNETDVYQRTCGQAQDFAEYVISSYACRDLLARPREMCDCGGGGRGSGSVGVMGVGMLGEYGIYGMLVVSMITMMITTM